MGIGCSKIKYDLCFKRHILKESSCDCGEEYEDSNHYCIECPNLTELRLELFNDIATYSDANIGFILYGSQDVSTNENCTINDAVHNFIMKSEGVQ